MACPLEENERARFYPAEVNIKGARAKDSVLLDYISLSIISCVAAALGNGDYKIVWDLLLASVCDSVSIVVSRIFVFVETPSPTGGVYYVLTIQEPNFFAAFGIMIFYIISLWVLRPCGVVRTCRVPFTLMDLELLVHQSHVLQCPEFWLQSPSDTEDHLRAQVTLANRIYSYGVYKGHDENEYVGIAPHSIPCAWQHAAANVGAGAVLPSLYYSIELARDVLRYGIYDKNMLKYAREHLKSGPQAAAECIRVRSNKYRSWRKGYRRPEGSRE
ncbi:hypothetical protein K456DRAFT_1716148 [Colletotrichum gloeosporioides 23]|nr:hypothetical protein K456DRAFT_1716148 [Colletotrichum gloeosporioides 23]KAJ0270125.1 hypothetical protein COL940_011907 [Colletotrichum noveboracense]KAJ0275650.1 hypothetical protein CBS470a_011171 [Colletotrichum nupharicola]KAJ0303043.1 hypothetical protein Brms1b_011757 [Colletotrichum noveboracense]